jgi:GNAT superfamily N-acetyltransferase
VAVIKKLDYMHLDQVVELLDYVYETIENDALFIKDEREFFFRHLGERGQIFGVFNDSEELVAYAVLAFPASDSDNIYHHYNIPEKQKYLVAMLDSCVVHPDYRGQGFQYELSRIREEVAQTLGYIHLLATVHPDNTPSFRNLTKLGLAVHCTKEKREGKLRHFMYKRLSHKFCFETSNGINI